MNAILNSMLKEEYMDRLMDWREKLNNAMKNGTIEDEYDNLKTEGQQIADEILSGRIAGGTQLKQEELAEMFGTSRIPIREAFQVLEGQGLIVRLATRRIYAVELS